MESTFEQLGIACGDRLALHSNVAEDAERK